MIPAVSVVIASYNRAQLLGATLDSILGQKFRDFEVIVVDDGSRRRDCAGGRVLRVSGPISLSGKSGSLGGAQCWRPSCQSRVDFYSGLR